jgi:acetylornithine deacetylase
MSDGAPTDAAEATDPVGLARELVSIPSHDDETRAGDAIAAWLREHTDATVTRDAAGNVLARRERGADGTERTRDDGGTETLALVGHHDVVAPDSSQIDGEGEYVVEERDGRLHGRGAADMKGSLAAAMCAFRDADPGPARELALASFVGEELGGEGARHAIAAGFVPEYAIVGEGSTGYSTPGVSANDASDGSSRAKRTDGVTDVAVAHKGRRASTVEARGVAAHASEPAAGENAIHRACEAVETLRNLDAPRATVLGESLAGSVAVTGVEGGSAWNVIPETCTLTVDERTVPGERAPLERLEDGGVAWTVDQDLPPMACDDEAFAGLVREAAAGAQDGEPELVTKPHATDAGWLTEEGTTCVVCGAAEPGEAHTRTESVSIDAVERCYRIYRNAAESW